jgi:cobalt-zinc-cadmium efflux system outer membrane protein
MRHRRSLPFLLVIAALGSPLARAQPEPEQTIREWTGKQIEWRKDPAADEEITRQIHVLVHRPLAADRAVEIALLNNRELQAALEEIGIAKADLIEAGLPKNPTFSGDARFPDRPPSATNFELSVAQDFLDLLLIPLRKKVAASELARTRLRVGYEILKLAAEVKTAFYETQAEQQLFGRLQTINQTEAAGLELSISQHEAGNIPDLDLANQQATYSQVKLEAAEVATAIRSSREKLNRLMGLWGDDTDWKITDGLPPIPAHDFSQRGLESVAMNQRPDLAAAKTEVIALVQSLGLTKTYRYVGTIEFGVDSERDTTRQRVTGPTLKLELPIFNRGQGRIGRLEAQLRQAERRIEADAISIRAEVREARDRLIAKRDLAVYYRDNLLPERRHILELTLAHYNSMLKSPYDLLLAKQNELSTEKGYIDAWRDYWIARADLERAVGGRLGGSGSAVDRTASSFKETKSH